MQNRTIKISLILGIIFLFICISIAPSVTSIEFSKDKTSKGNDLVEITLQLCKTSGVEDHKMFITQEQDEHLDILIENFKTDLEKVETREETIEIYNDMIISLDKLGILPESSSCKEVQQLVTGESNGFSKIKDFVEHKKPIFINRLAENHKESKETSGELKNLLCLIAGQTTETRFMGPIGAIISKIYTPLLNLINRMANEYFDTILKHIVFNFLCLTWGIFYIFEIFNMALHNNFNPIPLGANIILGNSWDEMYPPFTTHYNNAEGWVYTEGLLGEKNYTGGFRGKISEIDLIWWKDYIGVTGFTGIRIIPKNFYQGIGLRVNLETFIV